MEKGTFYTKRNLLLFSLFSFAVMALSLVYLGNVILRDEQEIQDTQAYTAGYQFYSDAHFNTPQASGTQPTYDFQLFYAKDPSSSLPLTFQSVSFQMCINPSTNATHMKVYEFFGENANWRDEPQNSPSWACYFLTGTGTLENDRARAQLRGTTKIGGSTATWGKTVSQLTTFMNGLTSPHNKSEAFRTKAVVQYNGVTVDNIEGERIRFDSSASMPNATLQVIQRTDGILEYKMSQISPLSPNTSLSNGGFDHADYKFCLNPKTNSTHLLIYNDFFGKQSTWNSGDNPPTWACYRVFKDTTSSVGFLWNDIPTLTGGKKLSQLRTFIKNEAGKGNANISTQVGTSVGLKMHGIENASIAGNLITLCGTGCAPSPTPSVTPSLAPNALVRAKGRQDVEGTGFPQMTVSFVKNNVETILLDKKTVTANYTDYPFTVPSGIGDVKYRVKFTNDKGERDLTVDYIEIGGTKYQTEATNTFSTGTHIAVHGCIPGYHKSETLHCNGYFEYLSTQTGTTPVVTLTPTPAGEPGMRMTQTVLGTLNGNQVILGRNCEVNNNSTGETITNKCGSGWKAYPILELAGSDEAFKAILTEVGKVDSLNMFKYKIGDGEYIKQTVLINGKDLYHRTCKNGSNKTKCIDEVWTKGPGIGSSEIGLSNAAFSNPNDKRAKGFDMTLINMDMWASVQKVRQAVLSDNGRYQWVRTCSFSPAQETISACSVWNQVEISTINTNSNITTLAGIDHHIQIFNNVTQIRQTWLDNPGKRFVTRLCPMTNGNDFDCNLNTADLNQNKWSLKQVSSLGLPSGIDTITWMDWFISNSQSFDMDSTPITIVPSFDTAVACASKTATPVRGGFYVGSRVDFTVNLAEAAPGPDGKVVVRDVIHNRMNVISGQNNSALPEYCEVIEGVAKSQVLGLSDHYAEGGSMLVSLLLLSTASGVTIYFITSHNKSRLKSKLFKEKPYLAGILGAAFVLVVGGSLIILTRDDLAPGDTPAATSQTYLECKLPAGTESFTYRLRIRNVALPGEVITNTAEVTTGNNPNAETCSVNFTVVSEGGVTPPVEDTLTPTPTPTPSVTPTPSLTPSPTPTDDPEISETPTPTPTETEIPEFSPTASDIVGTICGPADINGDGVFTIADFGKYREGFASYYLSDCGDKFVDYGVCGGKDANQDGFINLIDLGSENYGFARRYLRPTCDLAQLQQ